MTIDEYNALLDTVVSIPTDNKISYYARITDVRPAFGRIDWKVKPVAGTGEAWVDASRCRIIKSPRLPKMEDYK